MSATVRIGDATATITDWVWMASDSRLEGVLNGLLDPAGPSGSDPHPDLHAAQDAVEQIGGEVIEYDETEYVSGRVY